MGKKELTGNIRDIYEIFEKNNFKGLSIKNIHDELSLPRKIIYNILTSNHYGFMFHFKNGKFYLNTEFR